MIYEVKATTWIRV